MIRCVTKSAPAQLQDPAVVAIADDGALEHAVLAALLRAGRPLTCAALADAVGRRDVGMVVVRLAAAGRLRRTRKGWAPRRPPTPAEAPEHDGDSQQPRLVGTVRSAIPGANAAGGSRRAPTAGVAS